MVNGHQWSIIINENKENKVGADCKCAPGIPGHFDILKNITVDKFVMTEYLENVSNFSRHFLYALMM